jgi:hypothetical protein
MKSTYRDSDEEDSERDLGQQTKKARLAGAGLALNKLKKAD